MSFTPPQLQAINAPGNTLVVAGAGAGKTGTLVERCLRLLLRPEPRVPVSKVLVVTFTEAAAAEGRARLRQRLDQAAQAEPENIWIQEQIAGLDSAHISTLHSFCLSLVRDNFHELDLDPAVGVIPAEQAEILFVSTFEELLNEHFAGAHRFSAELKEIVRTHFGGWDRRFRDLARRLHHFTQTRPDPEGWFQAQLDTLARDDPQHWRAWFAETVSAWRDGWSPYLESLPAENENAHACAALLRKASESGGDEVVQEILARKDCWPKNKKGKHSKPFEAIFSEAAFLDSLRAPEALLEDWNWSRAPLRVLLQFAQQFTERYSQAKRERGVVDFHDLEQCSLRLLWHARTGEATPLAARWQKRFEAIFIDEYQDINAAQDLILTAVSRPQPPGNRFLVGDIKQSIYGFRQANPAIFRDYLRGGGTWEIVHLADNFRSHEGILQFINPLFAWLMRERVGGITYGPEAHLQFGGRDLRPEMAAPAGRPFPVELHLFVTDGTDVEEETAEEREDEGPELENAEKEARLVAHRLRELREGGFLIYHQKEKKTRAVEWRDMVVLLRAAARKLEIYAKAFEAAGVPLLTRRDGFFSAMEVLDLVNVLTILDNPLQDIPLVAVLRSPLFGLTANDLALVRVHSQRARFWDALHEFLEAKMDAPARPKIERFLDRFHAWRNPRECSSLGDRLESILGDTGYGDWLLGQPRGRQRHANVRQLLRVARQFDSARGESLYLFLRHLQELQDAAGDIEPAALADENAVRLMTVHQSKGLEFPIVAVADLGKGFNNSSQASSVLLHEKYGICSMIKPPDSGQSYPSLPSWLASRDERLATAGEEMRIFYVALTRAENRLLLFGSATEKQLNETWASRAVAEPFPQQLLKMRSWLEWFGAYAAWRWPDWLAGESSTPFTVQIHRDLPAADIQPPPPAARLTPAEINALNARFTFAYPHPGATREPAKGSVSSLRKRRSGQDAESSDIASRFGPIASPSPDEARGRGVATHAFLQNLDFSVTFDPAHLKAHATELAEAGFLDHADTGLIDFAGIASFWNSEFGRAVLARRSEARREFPFTVKATGHDLEALGLQQALPLPGDEFVVVQGVADLVVFAESEIWLVDFKTDNITAAQVEGRAAAYQPQLALYSLALERIYDRPVSRRGLFFLTPRSFAWR